MVFILTPPPGGQLQAQRWQCKICFGSASPLPLDVTSRLPPAAADLPGIVPHPGSAGPRGGCRHAVVGCAGGAPGRMPDPKADLLAWLELDETWLSTEAPSTPWPWSHKRPFAGRRLRARFPYTEGRNRRPCR